MRNYTLEECAVLEAAERALEITRTRPQPRDVRFHRLPKRQFDAALFNLIAQNELAKLRAEITAAEITR